jgi:hypothetical protein
MGKYEPARKSNWKLLRAIITLLAQKSISGK